MTWVEDPPRIAPADRGGACSELPHITAGRAWMAMHALYRGHGQLARLEGDHLELLLRTRWYGRCGYGSFGDFVREELQLSPRTARRRVALSRLTSETPELAAALDAGRLTACQILALSPLRDAPDLPSWIAMAEDCTVRDLERLVTNYVSDVWDEGEEVPRLASHDPVLDEPGRRIRFSAPVSAAVVWEHGLEMAKRVLGWEAPAYGCVEAILDETATEFAFLTGSFGGRAEVPTSSNTDDDGPLVLETRYPPEPLPDINPTRKQLEALERAIQDANDEIKALVSRSTPSEDDPDLSIGALASIRRQDRSLRLLLARLIREADAAGVFPFLGYRTAAEFLVARLKLSERTAARLMSESWTFEGNPDLARAFATGRIGLGQAYLVNRVAGSSTRAAFIHRAETVTHLQFEREIRFLERLADYAPSVAKQCHGPLPLPGLPRALIQRLRDLGWSEARIEVCAGPFGAEGDPAVDPTLMERLEGLLDVVALALEEHELVAAGVLPTLATQENDATLPGSDSTPLPTLATRDRPDLLPRRTTISFWAPESLITRWNAALEQVQRQHGPLPAWAAALFLVRRAVDEWERVDPSRRPAEWRIFERDQWHCRAPGCSSRRRLEAHHIVFRSQNGSDDPENLVTLCHAHHRRGIHEGYLRVKGTAPGELRWRLGGGKRADGTPRPVRNFNGSRAAT